MPTTFDFGAQNAADISNTGGPYGPGQIAFDNGTAIWTEGGISFSYSHTTGAGTGKSDVVEPAFSAALTLTHQGASGAFGPATLQLEETNLASDFFSGLTLELSYLVGVWKIQLSQTKSHGTGIGGNLGTFTITAPGTGTLAHNFVLSPTTIGKNFSKIVFTKADFAGSIHQIGIQTITTTINCLLAGTAIATPQGPRPIETLQPGDRILTADGSETTVKWLGEQPVNVRLTHPAKVNPIRIAAGALGDGLPERGLLLSADHAIAIDGLLINAGALVNGETIHQVRDMPLDGFTYYHIETEGGHELLLAEGVAAESFIDYADTDSFVNAHERTRDTLIPELDLPRISAARLVPQALRDRLADRAEALLAGRGLAIAAE